jgi:DNA-directed RNA polymerase omega subunit
MYYAALEKMLDKTDGSIYKLVVVASKRALELAEGNPKMVGDINAAAKPSTVALREISEGKVKAKE